MKKKRQPAAAKLRLEALEPRRMLATYFVDAANGADSQTSGAIGSPFQTIQRAADLAQAGDTVNIRAGVYREEVSITRSGAEGTPITFQAYNGEEVLVTTTNQLSGWTQHSGAIYVADFNSQLRGRNGFTLFVDGELMTEAHWSDRGAKVDTLVSSNFATMGSNDLQGFSDSALVGLPNDHWNGGFVWAQTSDFTMEARRIADFNGATGRITLDSPFNRDPRSGDRYLIYDHLNALDAPGEWYFDEAANKVYLWAPAGGDPDNYLVEAKVRDEGFDLNGNDYITISGIDFRGGDLEMTQSNHVVLEGARVVAPDRGFGPEGSGGARSLRLFGSNNVIRNNEFEYGWGAIVDVNGDDNQIVNNYFHDAGFTNTNAAVLSLRGEAERTLFSHNTVERIGRAAIGGVGGIQTVIQHNEMSRVALMTADVGAIYLLNNTLGNSVIHHNVFHSITGKLSTGVYLDNNASDVTVHHNISYNISAFGGKVNLPNSFVLWYNNTHYNSGRVDAWGPSTSRDASEGSRFYNNIVSTLDGDLTNSSAPAAASNNVFTTSGSTFVNAAAGDFRLRSGSPAIDAGRQIDRITDGFLGAAPDAGAVEFGQPMWEFGHNFATPPQPVYEWAPTPYSNQIANPSFDAGLASWTSTAGTPARHFGNAWNYRADALAIYGDGSVELKPGDRIEQRIEGLTPNTEYTFAGFARSVRDLQLENHNGSSGSFTTGSHRGETYLGGVNNGEWLRFNNVDFGPTSPLFDRIEIGTQQNSSLDVELRLGDPNGILIGTLNVPSRGEPWFMTRTNVLGVVGRHDLYVVFKGDGGSIGKFDRLRLVATNTAERVTLGATGFDGQDASATAEIGGAYFADASQGLTFTTGPNATSATLYIEKQGGALNGYVDAVSFTGESFTSVGERNLDFLIDPATGRAVLTNNSFAPITFDGYSLTDASASLRPADWFSLHDQELDGEVWFEANPSARQLAELTVSGSTTLQPGQSLYFGAVVAPGSAAALSFEYFDSSTTTSRLATVAFEDPGLPELMGDYNGDGRVDAIDYTVWRDRLGSSISPFGRADGNGNGVVDRADYLLWRRHYGDSLVATAAATQAVSTASAAPTSEIDPAPEPIERFDPQHEAATAAPANPADGASPTEASVLSLLATTAAFPSVSTLAERSAAEEPITDKALYLLLDESAGSSASDTIRELSDKEDADEPFASSNEVVDLVLADWDNEI